MQYGAVLASMFDKCKLRPHQYDARGNAGVMVCSAFTERISFFHIPKWTTSTPDQTQAITSSMHVCKLVHCCACLGARRFIQANGPWQRVGLPSFSS